MEKNKEIMSQNLNCELVARISFLVVENSLASLLEIWTLPSPINPYLMLMYLKLSTFYHGNIDLRKYYVYYSRTYLKHMKNNK
jgi:hypothetical protein